MRLSWIVHLQENLLDGVGDVQSSEGDVLERTSKAAVFSRISHRSTNI